MQSSSREWAQVVLPHVWGSAVQQEVTLFMDASMGGVHCKPRMCAHCVSSSSSRRH